MGDELSKEPPPEPVPGIKEMIKHASELSDRSRHIEAAIAFRTVIMILTSPAAEDQGGGISEFGVGSPNERRLCEYDEEALVVARMGFAGCATRTGKNLREAAVACSQVLEKYPGDSHTHFMRGWVWALLAKAGEAGAMAASEDDLNEALRLQPDNEPAARVLRGLLKFKETGKVSPKMRQVSEQLQEEDNEWKYVFGNSGPAENEEDLEVHLFDLDEVGKTLRQEDPPYPPFDDKVPLRVIIRCFGDIWGENPNNVSGSDASEDDEGVFSSDCDRVPERTYEGDLW